MPVSDDWITAQQDRVKFEAEEYGQAPRQVHVTGSFGDGIASLGEYWRGGHGRYCRDPRHCRAELAAAGKGVRK